MALTQAQKKQISAIALIFVFTAFLSYIQVIATPWVLIAGVMSSFLALSFFQAPQPPLPLRPGRPVAARYDALLNDRLQDLVNQQRNTYRTVYLAHPDTCHNPDFHYDWWLFPLTAHAGASETSRRYSVSNEDIRILLTHRKFMETYIASIDKYLANLSQFGWNHYEIRYEKMMRSLTQFLEIAKQHHRPPRFSFGLKIERMTALAQRAVNFARQNHITAGRMQIVIAALENQLTGPAGPAPHHADALARPRRN